MSKIVTRLIVNTSIQLSFFVINNIFCLLTKTNTGGYGFHDLNLAVAFCRFRWSSGNYITTCKEIPKNASHVTHPVFTRRRGNPWTDWCTMDYVILMVKWIHQLCSKYGQKKTAFLSHFCFISRFTYLVGRLQKGSTALGGRLNYIPNENDNMSVLKWHNRSRCLHSMGMLPSLKVQMYMWCVQQKMLSFILHRFTVNFLISDRLNQCREYVSAYSEFAPWLDVGHCIIGKPLVPEGIAAAEMWHKATKCPGLKTLVGVAAEQAFNMRLLNSDPYKHTDTNNWPEMYITCRAPGKLPRVQCSWT